MPRMDGTGPNGTLTNCVSPDGFRRPRMRYLDQNTRLGIGWGCGCGYRGGRRNIHRF